ncbi:MULTISPECIES: DUF1707 SHOCT-like domain-containing protein [Thermomonospora]|uniref:DUF1707 domain-containing protein n=1 Tax=Thermomonospora curvata (strain ATCC 19995 / DSM 43183 / JCM 3096 / KCTC 9072 / NBRC 15933 / NCIMB 10081 / Henssen B9) TaxID=471852 RepID=D1AC55_THECD|nr:MULTISPECIES: DUF1707 domain-containing protein [Thermomonospora]ACY97321.1 protein of unknown function DUF1707 [Thermomonospora curvata DSM 43183]PKK14687.1 MAG: DUF1707 domain-containing protein [Thermomonospora sp. CIF 1]
MDLRIGDAERDAVTEALHEHFAMGRLTRAELDERLEATLAAKTEGDLREIVKDLPGPHGLPEPAWQGPRAGHPHWAHWHGHRHHPHGHHGRHLMHHRHHHGPAPLVPILLVLFLIGAFTAGPAAGIVLALKAALVLWLAAGLFTAVRLHRRLRAIRR